MAEPQPPQSVPSRTRRTLVALGIVVAFLGAIGMLARFGNRTAAAQPAERSPRATETSAASTTTTPVGPALIDTIEDGGHTIRVHEAEPLDGSIYFSEDGKIPVVDARNLSRRGYILAADVRPHLGGQVFDAVPVYDEKSGAHIADWANDGRGWLELSTTAAGS